MPTTFKYQIISNRIPAEIWKILFKEVTKRVKLGERRANMRDGERDHQRTHTAIAYITSTLALVVAKALQALQAGIMDSRYI